MTFGGISFLEKYIIMADNNKFKEEGVEGDDKTVGSLFDVFSLENAPKYVNVPVFVRKEMPISTFFMTAGVLTSFGFCIGILLGTKKTGGLRNTMRSAPPGTVPFVARALGAGTLLCASSAALVAIGLRKFYGVETVCHLKSL
eukprot:gene11020-12845_t